MIERDESFCVRLTLEDGTIVPLPTVSGPWVEAAMRTALIGFSEELKSRGIDIGMVASVSVTAAIVAEMSD